MHFFAIFQALHTIFFFFFAGGSGSAWIGSGCWRALARARHALAHAGHVLARGRTAEASTGAWQLQ
jgi:hypothetical protein